MLYANFVSRPSRKSRKQSMTNKGNEESDCITKEIRLSSTNSSTNIISSTFSNHRILSVVGNMMIKIISHEYLLSIPVKLWIDPINVSSHYVLIKTATIFSTLFISSLSNNNQQKKNSLCKRLYFYQYVIRLLTNTVNQKLSYACG